VNAASVFRDCELYDPSCLRVDPGGTLVSVVVPLEANPLPREVWRTVIRDGHATVTPSHAWDNVHQTYKQSIFEPGGNPVPHGGCPECVHIHWRWFHGADTFYGL